MKYARTLYGDNNTRSGQGRVEEKMRLCVSKRRRQSGSLHAKERDSKQAMRARPSIPAPNTTTPKRLVTDAAVVVESDLPARSEHAGGWTNTVQTNWADYSHNAEASCTASMREPGPRCGGGFAVRGREETCWVSAVRARPRYTVIHITMPTRMARNAVGIGPQGSSAV